MTNNLEKGKKSNKATDVYNLKVLFPEIAKEWHPSKNADLTPDKVTPGSSKTVWWQCKNGHEWKATIFQRVRYNKCPVCTTRKRGKQYNLLKDFPGLMREWHPTKNSHLDPEKLEKFSVTKIWWKCINNHEWQGTLDSRLRDGNCPYCQGFYPSEDYNLAVINPELAAEWHPVLNGDLTPYQVTPCSGKIVWWICKNHHTWKAKISLRKRTGCPVCVNKKQHRKYNPDPITITHPELAKQWHPTKNGTLTPHDVSMGSHQNVWWICEEGHEWETKVYLRVRGSTCHYCSGYRISKDYNFQALYPEIAKQWHPTKNGNLKPSQFAPNNSSQKIWWVCEKGHEWQSIIRNRKTRGCPKCAVLKSKRTMGVIPLPVTHPDIAKEWHPTKNGELTVNDVSKGSHVKAWWICSKGHEWQTFVYKRCLNKITCPICRGIKPIIKKNLKDKNPEVAKQWHPTKNGSLTPDKAFPYSQLKVWWKCEKGHEWFTAIKTRQNGHGCPFCNPKGKRPGKKPKNNDNQS